LAKNHFDDSARNLSGNKLLVEAMPNIRADIENKCEWLEYSPGDVVIDLADSSTNVYFVVAGKLKAMDYLSDGREVALAELGPGDSFGELSAIDLKVRSARVTAMEPTLVASLPSKDFKALLLSCPEMALALLKRFSGFIRTLNTRITALSTLTPHQRIYFELLRICEPNTSGDGSWIIVNIPNHSEIATWIGAEKEIVADAIGKLARDGVVERKYKNLLIRDHARLQRLANQ
jgi:CRP-like cAMP-binding protein